VKILNYTDQSRVSSLIRLAEDPDPHVYLHVKDELVRMGNGVVPTLEQSWSDHYIEVQHRDRIFEIIRQIQINEIKTNLQTVIY
jgi:hypothetical protein